MLPTIENYESHIKSKSYKRAVESKFDIEEYEEIIIPHKNSEHFMFCQLTGAKLPKKKSVLIRHIEGKKFQRRYQECKILLILDL